MFKVWLLIDQDSESSDDGDDEEVPKAVVKPAGKNATKKDDSSKKRKADTEVTSTPKKAKVDDNEAGGEKISLFVGNLSWNVDEEWLTREFEEFGELSGVRLITDRDTGRSRGYG